MGFWNKISCGSNNQPARDIELLKRADVAAANDSHRDSPVDRRAKSSFQFNDPAKTLQRQITKSSPAPSSGNGKHGCALPGY